MKQPHLRVSVGMPAYNGERFIEEAIESILAQTHADFELLISDNASTDRTGEICAAYAARDRRIRYVRQPENIGGAANFRFVFESSREPYFMWAACDDSWSPNWIEHLLQSMTDEDAGVFGAYLEGSSPDRQVPVSFREQSYAKFFMAYDTTGKCYYSYALFRRHALQQSNFELFQCPLGGDQVYLLNVLQFGALRAVDGAEFRYRIHEHSVSSQQSRDYGSIKRSLFSVFPLEYYSCALVAVPPSRRPVIFMLIPLKYIKEQLRSWLFLIRFVVRKLVVRLMPVQ